MKIPTTALLATLLSLPAAAGIRALTPDMYGGDTNAWQVQMHLKTILPGVRAGGAPVVFIGDSITDFWRRSGKEAYAKYFADGPAHMFNLGVGADRTEHVLWRLGEGGELDGYEAKIVFLMIGTNNAGQLPFEKEPPADTILGIREILRVIRAKQPKATIVLTAIFPRGRDETDPVRHRNTVVNKEIQKFANGKDILWLDFGEQFLTPDGVLPHEVFPDWLHPAPIGYEIWYAAAKPYIDAALSDGRLPMPPSRYASCRRWSSDRVDDPPALFPETRIRSEGYGAPDWWLDRLRAKREQIAASDGAFDLVLFGDSITHHWENTGAEAYAELCRDYRVLNLGYSGDKTENLLWRGENGELDGYKATCVSLMIGTNNTWHRKDKPEDIAAGIRKILDLLARKQPQAKVLLMPIFPFGNAPDHPNRVNNDKANALIRGFADGEKVIWLDFTAKFLDEKGDTVAWMPDRCHPNAAGYREIWLPALRAALKPIVGK